VYLLGDRGEVPQVPPVHVHSYWLSRRARGSGRGGNPFAGFLSGLTAVGEYGTAEDIAAAVSYLAGPGARYVTGAAISVDGGFAA
jgi:NAD(P)-dependent dehydrogenase (short-subunit alcohol dehydrogenase family)